MSWVKIDDKLTSHPKWLGLSIHAKSLWFHAAVWCGAHNNDGHLPDTSMSLHGFTAAVPAELVDRAANELVTARLWARRAKSKGGGFEIVNWLDYQPSKAQVAQKTEADDAKAERKALHTWLHKSPVGREVKAIIRRRDGIWCRYCGIECVESGDRRSLKRLTYDLIDPTFTFDRSAGMDRDQIERVANGWAVACGYCNAVKQHRTPDQADLPIRPVHSHRADLPRSAANGSGPGLDPIANPGRNQVGSAAGQAGTGLDGADPVVSAGVVPGSGGGS